MNFTEAIKNLKLNKMEDLKMQSESNIKQELVFSFSLKDLLEVGETVIIDKLSHIHILFGIDFDSKMWATLNTDKSLDSFKPRTFAQQLKFKIPIDQYWKLIEQANSKYDGSNDTQISISLGISNDQKVVISFRLGEAESIGLEGVS